MPIDTETVLRIRQVAVIIASDLRDFAQSEVKTLCALGLVAVCLAALLKNHDPGQRTGKPSPPVYILGFGVFVPYVYSILRIAFFSRPAGSRTASVNFEIFSTWGDSASTHAFVLENIIFFIPLGLLIPIITQGRFKFFLTVLTGFLCSFALEAAQYKTGRGFCQIDDLIMNTAGTVMGVTIYFIVAYLLRFVRWGILSENPST